MILCHHKYDKYNNWYYSLNCLAAGTARLPASIVCVPGCLRACVRDFLVANLPVRLSAFKLDRLPARLSARLAA
jgi:hypothetical protein